jgi:hypothetical protein
MKCSRRPRRQIKRRILKIQRATSSRLIRRSAVFTVDPTPMSPKRKQKLTTQEVMAVSPTTPEYQKWTEVPITFNHSDHLDFIPNSGRYPFIVSPIIKDVKLNQVLVDGDNSLNILFLKTFDQMGCQDQHCALVRPRFMA